MTISNDKTYETDLKVCNSYFYFNKLYKKSRMRYLSNLYIYI